MKSVLLLLAMTAVAVAPTRAAEETLTGHISDALCGSNHTTMAQQVAPPLSDADCTKACLDARAQYVFVDDTEHKTIRIANQQFAGLKEHAGQTVKLTGERKDNAITVTKVEPASAAK